MQNAALKIVCVT